MQFLRDHDEGADLIQREHDAAQGINRCRSSVGRASLSFYIVRLVTNDPPTSPLPPRAVVAVFRAPTAEHFVSASEVLWDAGVRCFEYTLTTEGALDALVELRKVLPDAHVGVGTVRTVDHVRAASEAGAEFAVSQIFLPELAAAARQQRIPFIPGALTPTEVVTAWNAGVPAVKVSPIGPLGGVTLPEGVARPAAGRRDDADRWRHPGGRGTVSRRRRRCRRRQRCPPGRRPARRRSCRALCSRPTADVLGVEVRSAQPCPQPA